MRKSGLRRWEKGRWKGRTRIHNLMWSWFSVEKYRESGRAWATWPGLVVAWIILAMSLELLDFPPLWGCLDAHSLWHLGTVAPTMIWYKWVIELCVCWILLTDYSFLLKDAQDDMAGARLKAWDFVVCGIQSTIMLMIIWRSLLKRSVMLQHILISNNHHDNQPTYIHKSTLVQFPPNRAIRHDNTYPLLPPNATVPNSLRRSRARGIIFNRKTIWIPKVLFGVFL